MKNLKISVLLIGLFIVGCASSKKPVVTGGKPNYLSFRTSQSADAGATAIPNCSPSCDSGQICENRKNKDAVIESYCMMKPAYPPEEIRFALPFDHNTQVVCTHAPGEGSHSFSNAFYALDLATDYDAPAATIRAAADGVAYVYGNENGGDCSEPPGTAKQSQGSICGNSWGNHIKILHAGGYFSFYVHLDHALVKSGDVVKQGDQIGVMGWTGAAGHRHLHWSVQKLPGKTPEEWVSQIQNYSGASVPFKFRARQNGSESTFDMSDMSCEHTDYNGAVAAGNPTFSGVK